VSHVVANVTADDGCRLWTAELGRGRPLIMVHGGPGLWDMFGEPAAMLARRLRVIRWDQRGGGRSQRRGPYTPERFVRDLDAVRAHYGLARVALLGHSWGAQLALHYALAHPERVSTLVYACGVGPDTDWRAEFRANSERRLGPDLARVTELRTRVRTPAQDRELAILLWSAEFADRRTAQACARRMAEPFFEINWVANREINEIERAPGRAAALLAACRELPVPTVILDGARDLRPRWAVDSLAGALGSVTRVTLPTAGHVPWLEVPDEFYAVLLDRLGAAT
jgi:proline iminopeptidase